MADQAQQRFSSILRSQRVLLKMRCSAQAFVNVWQCRELSIRRLGLTVQCNSATCAVEVAHHVDTNLTQEAFMRSPNKMREAY